MKKKPFKLGDIVVVCSIWNKMPFGYTDSMDEWKGKLGIIKTIDKMGVRKLKRIKLEPYNWDAKATIWSFTSRNLRLATIDEIRMALI